MKNIFNQRTGERLSPLMLIFLLLSLTILTGCQDKEDANFKSFNTYCDSYCTAIGMVKAEGTKAEQYTYKCLCEKVFLKIDWLKEHGGIE